MQKAHPPRLNKRRIKCISNDTPLLCSSCKMLFLCAEHVILWNLSLPLILNVECSWEIIQNSLRTDSLVFAISFWCFYSIKRKKKKKKSWKKDTFLFINNIFFLKHFPLWAATKFLSLIRSSQILPVNAANMLVYLITSTKISSYPGGVVGLGWWSSPKWCDCIYRLLLLLSVWYSFSLIR